MTTIRHSRLGIASAIIAGAVPLSLVLLYALGIALGTRKGSPGNVVIIVAVVFSLLGPFAHLVGAGLGIGGLFTNRRKLFPVTGTVLNLILGLGGALILVWVARSITYGFR
ncbi:MAG: hypothetical protein J5I65_06635 [Aridibacter famidurans]|nr:hypothetical protein [Aridibacter famidurans]